MSLKKITWIQSITYEIIVEESIDLSDNEKLEAYVDSHQDDVDEISWGPLNCIETWSFNTKREIWRLVMMYRVVVEGEDHTQFCYKDDVFYEDVDAVLADAEEAYPCGTVWVENYRD